jgi:hypothetical protein
MAALNPDVRVVIVMPVYRDWISASMVCRLLDKELQRLPRVQVRALLVDDGSPDGLQGWQYPDEPRSMLRVDVLRLRANIGHQRAICTGLCYIHDRVPCDWILVMDADGEDRAEDAVRLIERAIYESAPVIFAERRKRLEGFVFKTGYAFFRVLHRMLTGVAVRVGNFSILSPAVLRRLVVMPELWNHYAGSIFRSKIQFECVPIDRGSRLHGKSKMSLVSLMTHGLAGIATFYETVATRILIFSVVTLLALLAVLAVVFFVRMSTGLAIPGWATYTSGLIIILFTQLVAISFNLVFMLISSRTRTTFVPARDYEIYIDNLQTLRPQVVSGEGAA